MMRRAARSLGIAIAVALGMLLAACGGDDDDGGAASGNTRERDESTTAAESTTTTVRTTAEGAVGPAEWVEIMRDVQDRLLDLGENPDPERVREVVAEECDCYQRFYDNTVAIADEGQRIVSVEPTKIAFVKVERSYPRDEARVTVKIDGGDAQFVDADGNVLQELPAGDPGCVSFLLTPDGAGGAYRIHDQLVLDGCPPEAG